jgi:hypothetical protein
MTSPKKADPPFVMVRIDSATYRRLGEAAERSGRPIAEEVRERLATSLELDRFGPETRSLLAAVRQLLTMDFDGRWHADEFAFRVFAAAIADLLGHWKPPEGAVDELDPVGFYDREKHDPAMVGHKFAQWVLSKEAPSRTKAD